MTTSPKTEPKLEWGLQAPPEAIAAWGARDAMLASATTKLLPTPPAPEPEPEPEPPPPEGTVGVARESEPEPPPPMLLRLRTADLRRAMAATRAKQVVLTWGAFRLGCIPKNRITNELRGVREGYEPEWFVDTSQRAWVCEWKGGRGRLRYRLGMSAPIASSVFVDLASAPMPALPAPDPACNDNAQPARERATKEDDMSKKAAAAKTPEATQPPTPPAAVEPIVGGTVDASDALAALDAMQLNASMFGTNGRKESLVILYGRTKPSREVARGKAATLAQAFALALADARKRVKVPMVHDAESPDVF